MAKQKKGKGKDDEWARAKKLCRLNARQIEMAKQLGMNPRKLPNLIPSPGQRWKAPVGEFIEGLHAKRFGAPPPPGPRAAMEPEWPAPGPWTTYAGDVAAHLLDLHDRLEDRLATGSATSRALLALAADLRRVADEIESNVPVPGAPCADLDLPPALENGRPETPQGDWSGELPF